MEKFRLRLDEIKEPGRLISYWKAEWKTVSVIIMTGIFYNAMMEFGPIIQGRIIDMIVGNSNREAVIRWILIFIGVIAAIQFSRYLKRYYVRAFANKTGATMRMLVYDNIINRSIMTLKDEKTGDLMTKAISDVGACVEGMRKFTTEVFDTGVLMTAYYITLLFYDVKLTLISSVFIPVAMFIAERMKIVIYKYSGQFRKQLSKVSDITLENVDNELLYRVTGVSGMKTDAYDTELADLEKKAVKANMLENSMQPVYKTIAMIGIVLVVFYGGKLTIDGVWTVGRFSAYITIFSAFSVKASKAAKLFNSVQKAQVSWQRIKPFLTGSKAEPLSSGTDEYFEAPVELKVDKLAFGIIESADFYVETGEIIGVTGPVASGKSTIGSALQGLFPYEGSITINGHELRTMTPASVSRCISFLGHDTQLLSDSIYNNITLGTEGNISGVLRDVCFDKDLETMPEGINTLVGASGIRLSGGQQSRIALARALYNRPHILVLDDPFAAVDVDTERRIMDNLRMNYSDVAIILISHRITAFDTVEKVLLVNDGKTDFDTHDNLMESSELYRSLFNIQRGVSHV